MVLHIMCLKHGKILHRGFTICSIILFESFSVFWMCMLKYSQLLEPWYKAIYGRASARWSLPKISAPSLEPLSRPVWMHV